MYYSEDVIEEVRSRNDIVAVISQVVNLQKKSGRYWGLCPFHNEKTGSFSVSADKQMYYCFGCGAGGNVISFVMNYENMDFTEALGTLAERAGIRLEESQQSPEARREATKKQKMLEAYKDAAIYYIAQLRNPAGNRAKEYFTKRKLTEETMKKFGLGYAPQNPAGIYTYLKSKGHTDEIISQSGLLKIDNRGAWDRFYNRAMFPIINVKNKVIGFGGRVMGEGEPKYLNSSESPIFDKGRNLYALNLAKSSKRDYMLLCEGYMDVIALHQAGIDCAVASLGTAFTSGHASLIKRYVDKVIITYDSDGAGQKAALRAIPILTAAGLSVKVLNMKPYKDPDEFICNLGVEEYEKRIEEAKSAFFFETDVMLGRYNMDDPESKTGFHRELARKIAAFSDSLERENYINAVSTRYSIPADYLKEMVNYIGSNGFSRGEAATSEPKLFKSREKGRGVTFSEYLVLNYVSSCGKPFEEISRFVRPEFFSDELAAQVAGIVFEKLSAGETVNPAGIIDMISDDSEVREKAARIFNTEAEGDEDEIREKLAENIKKVQLDYIKRRLAGETDMSKLSELIKQRAEIEKQKITIV